MKQETSNSYRHNRRSDRRDTRVLYLLTSSDAPDQPRHEYKADIGQGVDRFGPQARACPFTIKIQHIPQANPRLG
jgi:hypothetical protein